MNIYAWYFLFWLERRYGTEVVEAFSRGFRKGMVYKSQTKYLPYDDYFAKLFSQLARSEMEKNNSGEVLVSCSFTWREAPSPGITNPSVSHTFWAKVSTQWSKHWLKGGLSLFFTDV